MFKQENSPFQSTIYSFHTMLPTRLKLVHALSQPQMTIPSEIQSWLAGTSSRFFDDIVSKTSSSSRCSQAFPTLAHDFLMQTFICTMFTCHLCHRITYCLGVWISRGRFFLVTIRSSLFKLQPEFRNLAEVIG